MVVAGMSAPQKGSGRQQFGVDRRGQKPVDASYSRPGRKTDKQTKSHSKSSGFGGFLIAAGLLLSTGALLNEFYQFPLTYWLALTGLVFAFLGAGYLVGERGKVAATQTTDQANTHKIDQMAERLDAGIESLRDMQWEMRDSELRYRDLLDNQVDIIIRRDREGRINFVNDAFCQAFGTDQNTIIGAKFEPELVDGEGLTPFGKFAGGDRLSYEQELKTEYGLRWFLFEDVAIYDEGGEMREVHTVGRDITDEKKAADELRDARHLAEEANRAKTRFLATMSHEIRTPMNGIMGMTDLLTESNLSAEQRTYCRAISKSATTLLSLIDEILDFSKIEAGKFEMVKKPYNLADFAEGIVELMAPRAFEKGLSLGCYICPDLVSQMTGDEVRMRQILLNLVGNAIKFTDHGGVLLEISKADDVLRFAVSDTGIGLTKVDMERVFVEFEQVDGSNARRNGGTGLGLAITRRLVEKMGGEINVASVSRKGSVFTVDMPFEPVEGSGLLREQLTQPKNIGRVLVACDHELEGRLIGNMLKSIKIDAVVLDRRMAFEMLEDKIGGAFDAVITDAIDAPRFAEKLLRAAETHAGRPVKGVMLIEATDRRDYELLSNKGYGAYVTRPVRHSSLLRQLENVQGHSVVVQPHVHEQDFAPQSMETSSFGKSEEPRVKQIADPQAKASGHILLAEDNEINALLGTRLLEHMGYDVTHVTDGLRAVQAIQNPMNEDKFSAVLMDIHMPHMDGIRATEEIRSFEEASEGYRNPIPIIALTANAFSEVQSECYSVGMNAYLAKPFAREELREVIETALQKRVELAG